MASQALWRFLLAAAVGLAVLLGFQEIQGRVWVARLPLHPTTGEGLGAKVRLKPQSISTLRRLNQAWIEEDGVPLPLAASSPQRVREEGQGRFHIRTGTLWFSATDHTLPAANGRAYSLAVPHSVPKPIWGLAVTLLAFATWMRRRDLSLAARHTLRFWMGPWARPAASCAAATPDPGMASAPSRNQGLDFLRGIAVLLVFFHHQVARPRNAGWLTSPANFLCDVGWVGVDLFFVLSGYLIGSILLREAQKFGNIEVGRFMLRRAFKIWPSYFGILAVTLLATLVAGPGDLSDRVRAFLRDYWPNLLHCQNYWITPLAHTWTLSVEEHFYLLLPVTIFLCFRFFSSSHSQATTCHPFLLVGIIGIVLGNLIRISQSSKPQTGDLIDHIYHATHFRFDSLLFGCVLSYLRVFLPRAWSWVAIRPRAAVLLACLAMLATARYSANPTMTYIVIYPFLYLAFGALVVVFDFQGQNGYFGRASLPRFVFGTAHLGFLSYNFYLWHSHPLIRHTLSESIQRAFLLLDSNALRTGLWLIANATFLGVSYLVASLATRCIEAPFLRLRTAVVPSRSELSGPAAREAVDPPDPGCLAEPLETAGRAGACTGAKAGLGKGSNAS